MSLVHQYVHIVWNTQYGSPELDTLLDIPLHRALVNQARLVKCRIVASGLGPDHAHVLAWVHPTVALGVLVQFLKGGTSHEANQWSWLKQPLRWRAGYWAASVSPKHIESTRDYVERQRERHAQPGIPEEWQLQTPGL